MKISAGGVVLSLALFARVAHAQGPGQKPRTKRPTRAVTNKPTTKTTASTRPCNREACPPLSQKKYKICHVTGVATTETLCLPESGLTNHLKSHPGDYCGACSAAPSSKPSSNPSGNPSGVPSQDPSLYPSTNPSGNPSGIPSQAPSTNPSSKPSPTASCGNGVCDNGEDCTTCPGDCGACPPPTSSPTSMSCGNGVCDNGEDCNICPGDCGACPPPTSSPTGPMICQMEVGAMVDFWFDIRGLTIESLIEGTNNFTKAPDDSQVFPDRLEIPPNRKDPVTGQERDNYGVRMKGFIVPEESGPYTFWIASDDNGRFSLSPDRFRGGLKELCTVTAWVTCTTCYDVYPEQKSQPVDLVKGEHYYFEALMKEGPLEDYLSIAWQPPTKEREMIPGSFLSSCTDPNFDYDT